MNDEHGSSETLALLGSGSTNYNYENPGDVPLETIPWAPRSRGTRVVLLCPEFTSLCPKTGQPDFAALRVEYEPRGKLIESKALKMYLFAFRQHGDFHETVIDRIGRDLWDALDPYWLKVVGEFLPRGGISIWPTCELRAEVLITRTFITLTTKLLVICVGLDTTAFKCRKTLASRQQRTSLCLLRVKRLHCLSRLGCALCSCECTRLPTAGLTGEQSERNR